MVIENPRYGAITVYARIPAKTKMVLKLGFIT